ncbi:outer membrane protein (porin) [Oleiphilus messinensis]|uniref:Outer membrane protein (Porin) n=1 Tax=Oleiphilus messinensis TaxID=141451 RepID=A0A1Y0I610_9GAMM|nr:porin [Oleiphilus messinensis]ARU54833.1 outer membrane protein (porin) [Oleiphilus messinensis]
MKKTLIASAVAAATLSSTAFAMDPASELAAKLDSMPTVYGNIQLVWAYENIDGGTSNQQLADNGSTLGVKHEHEIAPGLTGFMKAELEFTADEKGPNGLDKLDEAYIGLKGNFGKVWVGSDDSIYESYVDKIVNYYEYADLNVGGNYDTGEGDLIQYETPKIAGGLTIGAAVQINGDAENADKSYPYQIGAKYSMDAITVAVAMDSNDGDEGPNSNTYGVMAGFGADNFSVSAEFQTREDVADLFGVFASFSAGANTFAVSYEFEDQDSGDEVNVISAQALHNMSDNMYVYVEGYWADAEPEGSSDSTETTQLALGAVYAF